ncbi:hypothetical protein ABPG72_022308 [Tetrahymena utriculariae]
MSFQSDQNILIFSQKGLAFRNQARINSIREQVLKKQQESEAKINVMQDELDEVQQQQSHRSKKLLKDISVFLTRNQSSISKDLPKKLMYSVQENGDQDQQKALEEIMLDDVDESKRKNKYVIHKVQDYSYKIFRNPRQQSHQNQSPMSQSVIYCTSPYYNQANKVINTNVSYDNVSVSSLRQRSLSPQMNYYQNSNQKKSQVSFQQDEKACNLYSPEKEVLNSNQHLSKSERTQSFHQQNLNCSLNQNSDKRSVSNHTPPSIQNSYSFNQSSIDDHLISKKYSFIINAENKIQKMIQRYDFYDSEYQKIQRKVQNRREQLKSDLDGSLAQSPDIKKHIDNENLLEVLLRQTNYQKRKQERIKVKQQNKYGKAWQNLYLPKIPTKYLSVSQSKQQQQQYQQQQQQNQQYHKVSQTIPINEPSQKNLDKLNFQLNNQKQAQNLYKKIILQIQSKK